MAVTTARATRSSTLSMYRLLSLSFHSQPQHPSSTTYINQISRVLSDYRSPHHDLETALTPFTPQITTNDIVQQVLKRTKTLGFSAHRFFLWAKKNPGFQPNITSYKILINVLGCSKQFPLIWDLLTEVRDSESFGISPEIFWVIFDAYCRAKLPNDAIRAFGRMREFGVVQSVNDVDHLLYLLCRRRFVREGQEFFDGVKGSFDLGVKSFSILIKGWGDVGDSRMARKVFEEMCLKGCVVDVPAYNSLLEALCNGGEFDEAYAVFRDMGVKGLKPDAWSYSIFIRSYCKRDDVHSAFRVLDRMKRYELVPNVYTFNCIVKRLCENEKADDAFLLLDEMINVGVSPDTWSYNTILAFHCDRNEVNRALRVLSKMEKDECKPDRHTYNMLLKMLIRIGRFDRVEQVWDEMPTKGFFPSVSTFAVMIHGLLKKKGKVEEACKYFERMIDEGIPPYSSTIEVLRKRLLGLGMLEPIDRLAGKMAASSSVSINELSETMKGHRSPHRRRGEDSSELSEEEWPFGDEDE